MSRNQRIAVREATGGAGDRVSDRDLENRCVWAANVAESSHRKAESILKRRRIAISRAEAAPIQAGGRCDGPRKKAWGNVKRWSQRYNWVVRASAWDREVDEFVRRSGSVWHRLPFRCLRMPHDVEKSEYRMTMDPSEKDALLYMPNAGPSLPDQMAGNSRGLAHLVRGEVSAGETGFAGLLRFDHRSPVAIGHVT